MQRTKFSNPLDANPGVTNGPSPSSESVKGGVHHGNTDNSTTRPTQNKGLGDIQDHVKGDLVGSERKH